MSFSATAFMCLYNEADIIRDVIQHLCDQQIKVHIIDNWSTDGSAEIAREFPLAGYEKFPADGPSQYYSWAPLLHRVEALAYHSTSDWCIHHDADEIRRSDRPNETLLEAFLRVHRDGYNAVNFQVYHFMPTDDLYQGDPEKHFRYFTLDQIDCNMRQVKAWKNIGKVDLATSGGHFAAFGRMNIYPGKFILKHYPLRTQAQAERKVLQERLGRYDPEERARKWHVQYNQVALTRQWLHKPESSYLQKWPS